MKVIYCNWKKHDQENKQATWTSKLPFSSLQVVLTTSMPLFSLSVSIMLFSLLFTLFSSLFSQSLFTIPIFTTISTSWLFLQSLLSLLNYQSAKICILHTLISDLLIWGLIGSWNSCSNIFILNSFVCYFYFL